MKSDPDFYPLAGAWINGTATTSECQLLSEILTNESRTMEEFGSLCRMEAYLHRTPADEQDRREALRSILFGRSWPHRAAGAVRRYAAQGLAAAALLALGLWYFWPGQSNGSPQEQPRPSLIAKGPMESPVKSAGDLLPPSPGLENQLRRSFVPSFQAHGDLKKAARSLTTQIQIDGRHGVLTVDVRNAGDAPVYLHLDCSLPAWTLFQIIAIQSGTRLQLPGNSLVFLADESPAPLDGSLSGISPLDPLRSVLGVPDLDSHAEELDLFIGLMETRFNGAITMDLASESSAKYTGAPRMVKSLECALAAVVNPPSEVRYDITVVALPAGSGFLGQQSAPPPSADGAFCDIFSPAQVQYLLNRLKKNRAARIVSIAPTTGAPASPVIADLSDAVSRGRNRANLAGTFTCRPPAAGQTFDLECHFDAVGLPLPSNNKDRYDTQVLLATGSYEGCQAGE